MIRMRTAIVLAAATALGAWNASTGLAQAVKGEAGLPASSQGVSPPGLTNPPSAKAEKTIDADFDLLAAFSFDLPDSPITNDVLKASIEKHIPDSIKKLDGKMVKVTGFMMATKEDAGRVTQFLVTRNQPSCCYSGATALNEFVDVKMAGKGVHESRDEPIAVEGKLHVGLVIDGGYVSGVYTMEGLRLVPVQ